MKKYMPAEKLELHRPVNSAGCLGGVVLQCVREKVCQFCPPGAAALSCRCPHVPMYNPGNEVGRLSSRVGAWGRPPPGVGISGMLEHLEH